MATNTRVPAIIGEAISVPVTPFDQPAVTDANPGWVESYPPRVLSRWYVGQSIACDGAADATSATNASATGNGIRRTRMAAGSLADSQPEGPKRSTPFRR